MTSSFQITYAQTAQQVGGLRGRVTDRDFASGIPNVSVVVQPSGRTGLTDIEGNFTIQNIPPGNAQIRVQADGYRSESSTDVVISAGTLRDIEIVLEQEAAIMDDFLVTLPEETDSGSALDLLDLRQNLDTFVEALGRDFLSKAGGSDVASAVSKVSGASVVDGRYIVVRGLADRYNSVLLNGLRIPTGDPDRRAVNADIFPTRLVQNLNVYKTFGPQLPGESTGATVNVETLGIPNGPVASGNLAIGYNTEVSQNKSFVSYPGAGTGAFGTLDRRELAPYIRSRGYPFILPSLAAAAEAQDLRDELGPILGTSRRAPPLNYGIAFTVGDQFEWFGRPAGLLVSSYWAKKFDGFQNAVRKRSIVDASDPNKLELRRDFIASQGKEELNAGTLLSAGYRPADGHELNLVLFYNKVAEDEATFQEGGDAGLGAIAGGVITEVDTIEYKERALATAQIRGKHTLAEHSDAEWAFGASKANQDEPDIRYTAFNRSATRYTLPSSPPSPSPSRFFRALDDYTYNLALDFTHRLFEATDRDLSATAKWGVNWEQTTRLYNDQVFAYRSGTDNRFFVIPADKTRWAEVYLDPDRLSRVRAGTPIRGTFPYRTTEPSEYEAFQAITAAYGLVDFDITENINVNVGARVEITDLQLNVLTPLNQQFTIVWGQFDDTPENVSISRTDILPAFSTSWEFAKDMNLRYSAARTVARPSFKELGAVAIFEPQGGDFFIGNPGLELSSITNHDLRWEWFPRPGDLVGMSAFTKFIDKPIELVRTPTVEFFQNAERASVYGLEFELQRKLDEPWPWMKDFSIGMNYAYIISRVKEANAASDRRLQGQPDFTFNVNLLYESENLGWEGGIFYNVVGTSLYRPSVNIGGDETPETYDLTGSNLEFYIAKRFGEHCKVSFRAKNLLRNGSSLYYETPNGGRQVSEEYDGGVEYSLSFSGDW